MLSQKNDEPKLDWMYKGPTSLVDREEYLLGRSVDKTLEQLDAEEKEKAQGYLAPPKNHVEHECIPPSIRDFNKIVQAEQVDLSAKLQEDPLVAIKKREEEARRQFLQNPVQLKKLQQALHEQAEKKKNKKKSKKHTSEDLDNKIFEKLKLLKQNPSGEGFSRSKKKGNESALDTILMHKFNQLKDKLTDEDLNDILNGAGDSDEETSKKKKKKSKTEEKVRQEKPYKSRSIERKSREDFERSKSSDDRIKRKSFDKKKRERSSSSSSEDSTSSSEEERRSRKKSKSKKDESSSDSEEEQEVHKKSSKKSKDKRKDNHRSIENKKSNETKNKKSRRRDSSSSSEEEPPRKKSTEKSKQKRSELEKHKKKSKKQLSSSSSSDSSSDSSSSSSSESDNDEKRKPRKNWGLVTSDGTKIPLKKTKESQKHAELPKPVAKLETKPPPRNTKRLSEKEKDKLRAEMMQNAQWREKDRSENVKRYKEQDKKEEQQRKDYDEDFMHRELVKSSRTATVEGRIRSNLNNIQRSSRHMDSNFARRH